LTAIELMTKSIIIKEKVLGFDHPQVAYSYSNLGLYYHTARYFKKGFEWLGFIYTTLALTFILNFLVGAVNLLPLPMFDGQRLLSINIKSDFINDFFMLLILICFVLNFLPWLVR